MTCRKAAGAGNYFTRLLCMVSKKSWFLQGLLYLVTRLMFKHVPIHTYTAVFSTNLCYTGTCFFIESVSSALDVLFYTWICKIFS